jgi:hypothetical protein
MDLARGDLDHKQHVQPLEQHRVHGEEVHRQDTLGLGPQELPPGDGRPDRCRSTPARCRMAQTVLAQACSRAGRGHRGRGGSPRSDSLWPAAAPDRGAPAPRLDDHAGAGRSTVAGPSPGASATASSAAPTVPATPSVATAAPAQPAPPGQPSPLGVGSPAGEAPPPRAATPAAPRPWLLSAAPAAPAIPAAGRSSDRAVVAPSTDHRRHRLPRRTPSSEPTVDFLAPTGCNARRPFDRPHARLDRPSAVLVVVVGRVWVVAGALTGPLGRPSTARLTVISTATGVAAQLPPGVRQRETGPGPEWRVVAAEVGEKRPAARPCHGDHHPSRLELTLDVVSLPSGWDGMIQRHDRSRRRACPRRPVGDC